MSEFQIVGPHANFEHGAGAGVNRCVFHSALGARSIFVALATAFASIAVSAGALSQTAEQRRLCNDLNTDAHKAIIACTAVIKSMSKPLSDREVAKAHLMRAIAYERISDFDRAIADNEKARTQFPDTVRDNIDELRLKQHWLSYRKSVQDEQDYANWLLPPSDAFWNAR